jgi:hypothetical protein
MKINRVLLLFISLPICLGFAAQVSRFEVASVKAHPPNATPAPGESRGQCRGVDRGNSSFPLGRCSFRFMTLKQLIVEAFPPAEQLVTAGNLTSGNSQGFADVAARLRIMPLNDWVTGGPGWMDSQYFEVEAKAEDPSSTTQDQLRSMLQTLVKERFKLEFHMEPKTVSGYFLAPAKDGLKLKEAEGPVRRSSGMMPFPMQQGTITQLATFLTSRLQLPVIDRVDRPGPGRITGRRCCRFDFQRPRRTSRPEARTAEDSDSDLCG